ncbi:zinc knuckle CX2CX4HX4C containing protein [Tanacetum coccineum]
MMVKPVWNNAQRVNHQNFAKKTHPCATKNMVPKAVLMKYGLVSVNTARQVNAHPQMVFIRSRVIDSDAQRPHDREPSERKNRTLIEAAKTMLADSKLPTTFWTEAVNTACYVQNRVLVTKPHNKTPYELFLGRKPALRFMRPFGCDVTILNTIDHLGKFDGSGLTWLFDIDALTNLKSYLDAGFKPSCDDGKKVDENPRKDTEGIDQEKKDNVNSTNNVNAASTNKVNIVGGKTSIKLPDDRNMPALEDIVYSYDDEDPIRFQLLTKIPQKYECAGDVVDFRTWPGISLETSMMSTMDLDGVTCLTVIMESLVKKKKQKGAILELKRRHLKNTIFCTYTPYLAMKIRRINASLAQETRNDQFLIWRIHYNQYAVKMDDPNITMEEYIGLKEEKAQNMVRCITGKLLRMTLNETPSCEPTVSSLNDDIDFRISFDESDDEDYTVVYDENSFSYKIISVNNLKTDSENDNEKVNMPSFPSPEPEVSYFNDLDFFKDFENEFPAIVYNDALMSKSDLLTEPTISPRHIDEFDLKDETSLSECDEKEQNVLYFNDLLPF